MFSQLYGHTEVKPFTLESSLAFSDVTFSFKFYLQKSLTVIIFHSTKTERANQILVLSANLIEYS